MSVLITWFDFGKYSLYIWPAYGIVVCLLLISVVRMKWQQKRTMTLLKKWISISYDE